MSMAVISGYGSPQAVRFLTVEEAKLLDSKRESQGAKSLSEGEKAELRRFFTARGITDLAFSNIALGRDAFTGFNPEQRSETKNFLRALGPEKEAVYRAKLGLSTT